MSVTESLKEEHRVIEKALRALVAASESLDQGRDVPVSTLSELLVFIRSFADRCHHGKEEDVLFTALERKGMPRQMGPIAVMLMEHNEGRRFVQGMAEAVEQLERGDEGAKSRFAANAWGYVELLTQHIQKEDQILYNMADRLLAGAEQKKLLERFEEIEEQRIGRGKHEQLIGSIQRIESELTSRTSSPRAAQ